MKNVFKVLGLALLASATMFVSCTKDEEKTAEDNKVVFGGEAWTNIADCSADVSNTQLLLDVYASKDKDYPSFDVLLATTKVEKYSFEASEEDLYIEGSEVAALEYYEKTSIKDEDGDKVYEYGDWWGKKGTVKLAKFDATNAIASIVIDATMIDAWTFYNDETVEVKDLATKSFEAKIYDFSIAK